jgi:esterase/lipase superfamily enzyme
MIRPLFALTVLLLTACQPPVELMPAPAIFVDNERNLFGANANLDESNEIRVFFATNRVPFGPVGGGRTYTVFPGDDLHLGVANLNIGGGAFGWDWLYEKSTNASSERRPQILLDSMDEKAMVDAGESVESPGAEALEFFRQIDEALARSADANLTIYVHGANTSVGRATAQAAQYRHFTGRNSTVLSFIWPSAENFLRFSRDVDNAGRTAPAFARLLRMLATHTRASRINVIAYSSGAMVASPALAGLGAAKDDYDPRSLRLGEIYYPAPDADFRQFVRELQAYRAYPERVTVTANLSDSVLVLSRLHQRGSRAGRPDPDELSVADSQWLVASSARDDFDLISARSDDLPGMNRRSHIFWYDHPWVSSDVLLKMLFRASPAQRGLQQNQTDKDLQFWTFPPDYPTRLDAAVEQIVQKAIAASSAEASPAGRSGG